MGQLALHRSCDSARDLLATQTKYTKQTDSASSSRPDSVTVPLEGNLSEAYSRLSQAVSDTYGRKLDHHQGQWMLGSVFGSAMVEERQLGFVKNLRDGTETIAQQGRRKKNQWLLGKREWTTVDPTRQINYVQQFGRISIINPDRNSGFPMVHTNGHVEIVTSPVLMYSNNDGAVIGTRFERHGFAAAEGCGMGSRLHETVLRAGDSMVGTYIELSPQVAAVYRDVAGETHVKDAGDVFVMPAGSSLRFFDTAPQNISLQVQPVQLIDGPMNFSASATVAVTNPTLFSMRTDGIAEIIQKALDANIPNTFKTLNRLDLASDYLQQGKVEHSCVAMVRANVESACNKAGLDVTLQLAPNDPMLQKTYAQVAQKQLQNLQQAATKPYEEEIIRLTAAVKGVQMASDLALAKAEQPVLVARAETAAAQEKAMADTPSQKRADALAYGQATALQAIGGQTDLSGLDAALRTHLVAGMGLAASTQK